MKIATLLAALLLAAPLTAHAQDVSYETAVRAYHAALQIRDEVWMDNPNQVEAMRHAMMIARNWGLYPGFEPAAINPNMEPEERVEGDGCFWYYDEEAGEWRERCSEWRTYQCNTVKQLEDMDSLRTGAYWFMRIFQGAGLVATATGNPFAVVLFGTTSLYFGHWHTLATEKLRQYEGNRCVNP